MYGLLELRAHCRGPLIPPTVPQLDREEGASQAWRRGLRSCFRNERETLSFPHVCDLSPPAQRASVSPGLAVKPFNEKDLCTYLGASKRWRDGHMATTLEGS